MQLPSLQLPKWQIFALPAVCIMLGVFYFGKYFVAAELIRANHRVVALMKELESTRDLLAEERARATVAEREADVMRRANALLRESERKRQDEIAGLQADLDFYRRLGGANGSQSALTVHYLELQPTQSPRVFRAIFSLTQNLRRATVISGQIQLEVDGIRNGVAEHLTNEQLLADSDEPLSFRFKYFEQFERLITLPEGFEASKLTIQLKSSDLKTPVEQSLDWESLINQAPVETTEDELPLSFRRNMIEKTAINRHS
ncbi:MAG TPA: DUF6776 family protein [Xanthomonadales bacterium]